MDKTHASGVSASIKKDGGSVVAESANAYHTPNSSSRLPPRLKSSHSAPPAEMEAMVHPSPSQEAFNSLTRANSFHGFPGGDTQPMESQVYRDFTASIAQPSTTTPKKPILQVEISPDGDTTYNTVMPDDSPKTCVEGETGYIDLGNADLQSSPAALSTSSHVNELLANPQTQHRADDGFTKPAMPETPAIAGHKRNSDGEIVTDSSTNKKTPTFTQLFGMHNKGQMLTATQLFDQTQAPSSPQPNAPRSDPVMTRPSPNLHNNFNLTSPTIMMSSPVFSTHSRPATAGEPRANYTSMLESQERRAKLRQEFGLRWQLGDVDDIVQEDEEEDENELRYAQQKRQREIEDQARSEWSRLRASSRPSSRPTSRQNSSPQRAMTIDLITPAPNKERLIDIDGPEDDVYRSEDDLIEEQQPADVENSDDEYDELAQTVLRSQANNEDDLEEEELVHEPGDAAEDAGIYNRQKSQDNAPEHGNAVRYQTRNQDIETATQHSAIADSQPNHMDQSRPLFPQHPIGPSSIPSIIPGSPYATKPGQDQFHVPMVEATSSNKPNVDAAMNVQESDVPSSPPIQTRGFNHETSNVSEPEPQRQKVVPESDLPGSDSDDGGHCHLSGGTQHESNPLLYYSARTHASATGLSPSKANHNASPLKVFASQQSKVYSQSPRAVAGVRHFADITAAASPPQGSGEMDVDVDAIMSDVVTADDQNFIDAVSTPSEERRSKRRKIARADTGNASTTSTGDASEAQPQEMGKDVTQEQERPAQEAAAAKAVTTERALRDSPSKTNELRSTTPSVDDQETSTPDSVKKREEAGATAASQLLSNTRKKMKPTIQYGKSSNRPSVLRNKSSTLKGTRMSKSARVLPKKPSSRHPKATKGGDRVANIAEEEETTSIPDNEGGQDDDKHTAEATALRVDMTDIDLRTPNRVFALFKGNPSGYYAATCLGISSDGLGYRVKFDDDTVTSIESHHVCRLELLVGDLVKVDLDGMRNKTWQVTSFGGAAQDKKQHNAGTDMYGQKSVKISAKSNRSSDANEKASGNGIAEDDTEVAIGTIYLTRTMWPHFENRTFSLGSTTNPTSRSQTPAGERLAGAETSASRFGRTLIPTARASGARTSHLRDESVSAPDSPSEQGLFSGMAFAISYGSNEGEKAEVTRLIRRNGGIVLEDGFDCLFSLPNLDDSVPTSPAKKSPRKSTNDVKKGNVGLQLKPEYSSLGFVALIADRHSRRAKYVQALALSLPTLSGKWISDSLDSSKNGSIVVPLPWSKYLLPAGESSYLGGAIRSRTMSHYSAAEARLSVTMENRDILLNGDGVLIVASKKGKSTWERRKPYAFLTLALGAAYVKRVSDLVEAKAFAENGPEKWKWIYVDGSVADASSVVFAKGGGAGKKRKRGDEIVKVDEKAMWASDGKLRIVNDEFVVQSLILGALVD